MSFELRLKNPGLISLIFEKNLYIYSVVAQKSHNYSNQFLIMPSYHYIPAKFEPQRLSKEEIENPKLVIDEFFDYVRIERVKEFIWKWLKVTVTGEFDALSMIERSDLFYLYERIEKLIEAIHVMYETENNITQAKSHPL
jgi:hypothetical protein